VDSSGQEQDQNQKLEGGLPLPLILPRILPTSERTGTRVVRRLAQNWIEKKRKQYDTKRKQRKKNETNHKHSEHSTPAATERTRDEKKNAPDNLAIRMMPAKCNEQCAAYLGTSSER